MQQPTTIQLDRVPTLTLRVPRALPADAVTAVAAAALAVVLVLSLLAAVAGIHERPTGIPTRITEPALVVRPAATPAAGAEVVEPRPAPAPAPRAIP